MNNADNRDIEKILKKKMDGLASSVDCFDKISSRAYGKDNDFFENGETVTELENVTGRKSSGFIMKICAGAAAALALFTVLSNIQFPERVMSNISEESADFKSLIEEANYEINNNDYIYYDIPLDYYYHNALMITPLYDCPFRYSNNDNSSVRLYIKTINNTPTNQMYAFEYTGTYSEDSIIAAAETSAEITDSDINSLGIPAQIQTIKQLDDLAVSSLFCEQSSDILADTSGNNVTLASIDYNLFYKSDSKLLPVRTLILYGTETASGTQFYDIMNFRRENVDLTNNSWSRSIYSNGYSAAPESSGNIFEHRELFKKAGEIIENEFAFVSFDNSSGNTDQKLTSYNFSLIGTDDSVFKDFGNITVPLCSSKFKIYSPSAPFERNTDLHIKLTGNDGSSKIYTTAPDSIFFNEDFYYHRIDQLNTILQYYDKKISNSSLNDSEQNNYREVYDNIANLIDASNDAKTKSKLVFSKEHSNPDNNDPGSIAGLISLMYSDQISIT